MAGQIPYRGQPAARGSRRMTRRRACPAWSEKSTRVGERINCLLYWYKRQMIPGRVE